MPILRQIAQLGQPILRKVAEKIADLRGPVPRHSRIGFRYLTRSNEVREEEYDGFLARVLQHEFDHVNGVVFIDRVESTLELVTEREYLRSQQISR